MTRPTFAVVAVRLLIVAAGVAALLCVLPLDVVSVPVLTVSAALALAPAIVPGTWLPTAFELLAVAGWLVRTIAFPEAGLPTQATLSAWIVPALLATALYVHHSGCTLAAMLPWNAVIEPSVSARWALRTLAVVAPTALLAAAVALIPPGWHDTAPLPVPVIGIVLVLAIAAIPTYAFLRRTS